MNYSEELIEKLTNETTEIVLSEIEKYLGKIEISILQTELTANVENKFFAIENLRYCIEKYINRVNSNVEKFNYKLLKNERHLTEIKSFSNDIQTELEQAEKKGQTLIENISELKKEIIEKNNHIENNLQILKQYQDQNNILKLNSQQLQEKLSLTKEQNSDFENSNTKFCTLAEDLRILQEIIYEESGLVKKINAILITYQKKK